VVLGRNCPPGGTSIDLSSVFFIPSIYVYMEIVNPIGIFSKL